ncbi:MAG: alpha/beta fold hydrolase [Caldilineae bacterium]|nr:MAG: alpha/beta fold hydrolase [Caldilineae bacterium]
MPRISVGDIHLYYEERGTGEPLLFLHGLGSSTRDWALQVDAFAGRYRVITVDARGHGQSDKPPGPYSIPQMTADVVGLLERLDVPPAHVVGLSMGGMMAFQLAVDAPERVKSLTIVNSGPALIPRTVREKMQIWSRELIVRLLGMRKMGEVLANRLLPGAEHAGLRQTFIERWAENDKRAYLASFRALVGWSVADRLGAIRCPVLVIAAEHDYTPVAVKEAYVAQMPDARLVVIPHSRHATPVERPDAFNEALAAFLDSVTGGNCSGATHFPEASRFFRQ